MGKKLLTYIMSTQECYSHREESELTNEDAKTIQPHKIHNMVNFCIEQRNPEALRAFLLSDYIYPDANSRLVKIDHISPSHWIRTIKEKHYVRPIVEHLYYDKPALFNIIAHRILATNQPELINMFASACEQTDLSNELAALAKPDARKNIHSHIDNLRKYAEQLRADVRQSRVNAKSPMYLRMNHVAGDAMPPPPVMSETNIRSALKKAKCLDKIYCSLKESAKSLFVNDPNLLSGEDKLKLLQAKLSFLSDLHKSDAVLDQHREFGQVICGNLATMVFLGAIPNIANKLYSGHFFFASQTESMKRVHAVEKDISTREVPRVT